MSQIDTNNLPAADVNSKIAAIKFRMHLAKKQDIDFEKWKKAIDGVIDNLPMLAGKYCAYLDCQANSVKPNAATVGEIAPQGQLTIAASLEGITKKSLQWIYRNNGEEFVVIWENCMTGEKFIAGSPCSCLKLTYEALGVIEDWQGATIKFVGTPCPEPFWFFSGEIPLPSVEENPEQTV